LQKRLNCSGSLPIFEEDPLDCHGRIRVNSERLIFLQGFEKLALTKEQRAEKLDQNNWSKALGVDRSDLAQLADYLVPYQGPEGAVVFRRGDQESFMCLISSGGVHIFESEAKNASELIASIGPENTVGEMALIDGEPRSAFACAAGETVLFVMTRSNFMKLAEDHPAIWGKLILRIAKLMSSRLRRTNEIAAEHLHS
jgi:CRP/FNR family transcriptional regulator, cyclic AMP receptor protein